MYIKNMLSYMLPVVFLFLAVHVSALSVGDWDFCSKQNPCSAGQGDCDADDECKPGLKCMKDVGPQYGFDKGVDVCVASTTSTSSSSSSGTYGGGVTSSTSTSSTSTSSTSTSSGTNPLNLLLSSSTSSSSSGASTSSSGGCQLQEGTLTYCAVCGPCSEGQSVCTKNSECKDGLVCNSNGFCVKP